jgi:hypothetical protein
MGEMRRQPSAGGARNREGGIKPEEVEKAETSRPHKKAMKRVAMDMNCLFLARGGGWKAHICRVQQ